MRLALSNPYLCLLCWVLFFTSQVSHADNIPERVYQAKIPVGPEQPIGTLAPISVYSPRAAETAIVLIPGLNGVSLKEDLYEWRSFYDAWLNHDELDRDAKAKYAIFVLRYDGWQSLYESSCRLARALREMLKMHPNITRIKLVGYSQGGLIARILLSENTDLAAITDRVITMAAPHTGTPTLTENLLKDAIRNTMSEPSRSKYMFLVDLAVKNYAYAFTEQAWNDFDGSLAEASGYTPPAAALNIPKPTADLSKFVAYGSYRLPPAARTFGDKFTKLFGEVLPRNLLLERHSGMLMLNRLMGTRIYPSEANKLRAHMRLNDGCTPLVSAIWGRLCSSHDEQPPAWKSLFGENMFCPTVPITRAFRGVDHLDWRSPRSNSQKLLDELHPQDPPKTIFDWIFDDLLAGDN